MHLNSLIEFFHRYVFPKDTHEDIYATTESTDKYLTAVLELQPVVNELIKKYNLPRQLRNSLTHSPNFYEPHKEGAYK
ncbi:hypothetical protein [Legionella cherrii]|uniref:Uncharacterized protein n=1 Tax=Legionella cherrii TaxID=28084 RepID=A0A0W0S6P6_9GAMM|nr:hypothetical protein [Legionella cherrii]KTC79095.1 hypothetical protein Lche_1115 [Legionella cherrii]VEB36539.1 Uncharacterised protein [Legionella cherrii]